MNGLGSVSRRRALATLASTLAYFAGLAPLQARPADGTGNSVLLHSRLARLFGSPRSARAVGAAYLATFDAGTALPEPLVRAIVDDASAAAMSHEARRMIEARIRQDFADGAIVTIDNWMLSRTEAVLCALATCSGGHADEGARLS